jgi:hypothetical protein
MTKMPDSYSHTNDSRSAKPAATTQTSPTIIPSPNASHVDNPKCTANNTVPASPASTGTTKWPMSMPTAGNDQKNTQHAVQQLH